MSFQFPGPVREKSFREKQASSEVKRYLMGGLLSACSPVAEEDRSLCQLHEPYQTRKFHRALVHRLVNETCSSSL